MRLVVFVLLAAHAVSVASWRTFPTLCVPAASNAESEGDCKDGVCNLPSKTNGSAVGTNPSTASLNKILHSESSESEVMSTTVTSQDDQNNEKLQQLIKMGWDEQSANRTLVAAGYDLEKAAVLLDEEEREKEEVATLTKELVAQGNWRPEIAESAILQAGKNATQASLMLEQEESIMLSNFEAGVKDMLANGWDEIVARQALLAQYTLEQRKQLGMNTTVPADVLATIRPTLKKVNETTAITTNGRSKSTAGSSKGSASSVAAPVKEARKEDVVFEVTAQDFQRVVMDSAVPVLVDVYADWCGPCKQLGPILENAAVKSGGMFRLVKINSDKQREIAETLGVSGLPTVFAMSSGKVTDRFVGMLPQDQLQTFMVRAVTGYGDRVQADQISDAQLAELTRKIENFAGLTSLSFKKLSKLKSLVDGVLECEGALREEGDTAISPSEGLLTAIKIIKNAHADIRNGTFRSISKSSQTYLTKIEPSPAALTLLDVAGFKDANNTLALIHTNAAILSVVLQRIGESIQRRKNDKLFKKDTAQNSASNPPPSKKMKYALKNKVVAPDIPSSQKLASGPAVVKASSPVEKKSKKAEGGVKKILAGSVAVMVRVGEKETPYSSDFAKSTTLQAALDELLTEVDMDWKSVEIRYPTPRRLLSKGAPELSQTLDKLIGSKSDEFMTRPSLSLFIEDNTAGRRSRIGGMFGKKRSSGNKKPAPVAAAKEKKYNEYFGGDSTVTLAGEDEDDEEEEE